MSDEKDDTSSVMNDDGTLTGLETNEDAETWIRFLVQNDVMWNEAQMVYDDDHLVLRVKWPDGEQVAFHCEIKRKMKLVLPEDERENN